MSGDWIVVGGAVAAFVLLVILGVLRSSSRYRATKPAEVPQPEPPVAEPRRVPAHTLQDPPLRVWVARAERDAIAAVTCPLAFVPISPDPRRKES